MGIVVGSIAGAIVAGTLAMRGIPESGRPQHAVKKGAPRLSDNDWHVIRSSLEELAGDEP